VEDELKTARAQAGGATADTSTHPGKGAGKAKKHQ
jgi:hypothetical protein